MGPGPEESALGQACSSATGKSKRVPPCVDDDDEEDEEDGEEFSLKTLSNPFREF